MFWCIILGLMIGIATIIYFIITVVTLEPNWLSAFASVCLVGVTIYYAVSAHKQADEARKSTELLRDQIRLSKQPCIIPSFAVDTTGSVSYSDDIKEWKLTINVIFKNYGDSPALNILSFACLELLYSSDEKRILQMKNPMRMMSCLPPSTNENESMCSLSFQFNQFELAQLLADMNECRKRNPRYSRWGSDSDGLGPKLVIKYLYRNILDGCFYGVVEKRLRYFSTQRGIDLPGNSIQTGSLDVIENLGELSESEETHLYISYAPDDSTYIINRVATEEDYDEFKAQVHI